MARLRVRGILEASSKVRGPFSGIEAPMIRVEVGQRYTETEGRPYQGVRTMLELNALASGESRRGGLVVVWWGSWILSTARLVTEGPLAFVASLLWVVAGVTLALIVVAMERQQLAIARAKGAA